MDSLLFYFDDVRLNTLGWFYDHKWAEPKMEMMVSHIEF